MLFLFAVFLSQFIVLSRSDAWHKHKSSVVKALAFYTTGQDPIKRSMMENSTNQHASQLIDQLLAHASDEVLK